MRIKAIGAYLKSVGDRNIVPFDPPNLPKTFPPPSIPTTLVACSKCGRGWPPRYMVAGMCRDCAEKELKEYES